MYDVNQLVVLHFKDKDSFKDATAYANPVTVKGVTVKGGAEIAAGAVFNGQSSLSIAATPANAFAAGGGFSFSAWVNSAAPQDAVLFARQAGGIEIGLDAAGIYAKVGADKLARVDTPLAPGGWHLLAVTASDKLVVYLDGKPVATLPVAMPALNGDMVIGAAADGSRAFKGELDEVRVAKTAYPADWFVAEMGSEGPGGKLLSYDASEGNEGGSTSYFGTILHSVTLDGWVVIGILMVMAAISWVVMIGKGLVIRRMGKDNAEFMASYHKLAADPGALDRDDVAENDSGSDFDKALFGAHDHYQSSPIYRIYHVGVQEIKHRFGTTDPAKVRDATLSPQAIEAIRATLDATLTRENQKLNKQMVLLTIAISGGPFLGLLGTVVGVMITFAAIAAAGDVNVNAIAPGIAAALVATVAGLAVAIPALFGYNYLASRIKDIHADMQVFVDEFIGRVAERYQGAETTRGVRLQRGAA
jgi:biopolymer transport protein ExbB